MKTEAESKLAEDDYSRILARLNDNPEGAKVAGSTIDLQTILGHSETWIVKTIRVEGRDTVFVQRINASGGMRLVLPPEVAAAIARQRDAITGIVRRRAARRGVATKNAKRGKK